MSGCQAEIEISVKSNFTRTFYECYVIYNKFRISFYNVDTKINYIVYVVVAINLYYKSSLQAQIRYVYPKLIPNIYFGCFLIYVDIIFLLENRIILGNSANWFVKEVQMDLEKKNALKIKIIKATLILVLFRTNGLLYVIILC